MPKISPRKEVTEHPLYRAAMAAQHLAYQLMREVPPEHKAAATRLHASLVHATTYAAYAVDPDVPDKEAQRAGLAGDRRSREGAARAARPVRRRRARRGEAEREDQRALLGSGKGSLFLLRPQDDEHDQEQEHDQPDDDRRRARRAGGQLPGAGVSAFVAVAGFGASDVAGAGAAVEGAPVDAAAAEAVAASAGFGAAAGLAVDCESAADETRARARRRAEIAARGFMTGETIGRTGKRQAAEACA